MRPLARKRKRAMLLHGKRSLMTYTHPESIQADQYRQIRAYLQVSNKSDRMKKLLISSPSHGEGKTTTSVNLAISLAHKGDKVLLIDAQMKRPMIHHTFNIKDVPGLTNVLAGQIPIEEAIHKTEIGRLEVLVCGSYLPQTTELLVSEHMSSLLEKVEEKYDVIILDVPSVLESSSTLALSNMCDGIILVIRDGKTKIDAANAAKQQLEQAEANMIGVVLNKA